MNGIVSVHDWPRVNAVATRRGGLRITTGVQCQSLSRDGCEVSAVAYSGPAVKDYAAAAITAYLESLAYPRGYLRHVADHANDQVSIAQSLEGIDDFLECLGIQRTEALVDENGF
jgi:hypothetical protein